MNNGLKTTIKQLTPAVLTSLIATSLGLLSLFTSKVPMIQDFGMMLAIGIAVAFVMALFVLLPFLTLRTKLQDDQPQKKATKPSVYTKALRKFARGILKGKYVILILAVLLTGSGFYVDQDVGVETDFETFMPQDSEALTDIHALRDIVGSTDRIVILYESTDVSSYDTLSEIDALTKAIQSDFPNDIEMIGSVTLLLDQVSSNSWDDTTLDTYLEQLPQDQLKMLLSTETNQGIINIALSDMDDDAFAMFLTALEDTIASLELTTTVTVTGQSVVDQAMLEAMTSDRLTMTLIGIGLVFVALLLIYRNLFKALIAVLPIVFIVGWSGGIMYLLGFDYTPLTSTLGALIIGIGTEFTILILMRYYELKRNQSHQESIVDAVGLMGKPIIVSALTTMGGFSALIFSDFQILSNFGIMTVINLALALISALVVLPALIAVMGNQAKALASD